MEKRIIVKNIRKKFKLCKKDSSFLGRLLSFSDSEDFLEALKNISFEAKEKENIGIIGSNGSGKSTLLKIIGGIYEPDCGEIILNGEAIYLSGFNNGLKSKLTMKENIFLIGSIFGLSKRKIKKVFKRIIDFSGLERFLDVKINKFSTGMLTRLNFATRINFLKNKECDILLLDEVFSSGGDKNFKEKVKKEVDVIMKKGATILIASHDLRLIKDYCDKAIWIEKGEIKKIGNPKEVVAAYEQYSSNIL